MDIRGIMVYYNEKKEEIKRVSLLKAPFKEDVIKEKSVELYNDNEPCIIYMTACINKLGLEMKEKIKSLKLKEDELFNVLESGFYSHIEFPKDVSYISFL